MQNEIGFRGGGLKIKCNEIKSKTVKDRIISFASVKYVIVFFLKEKRNNKILLHCYSKAQLWLRDWRQMLGISSSDKVEKIRVRG